MKGKAHRFIQNDDINTDYIIPGRYKFSLTDPDELAKHCMEDLDNDFSKKISKGDLIVAGENFGCGSSREEAPLAIKHAGIACVIAKSFARIFYRNCVNIGLPIAECDTDGIDDGDILEIDFDKGTISNIPKKIVINTKPMPDIMKNILNDGGLIYHFKKHSGFKI